MFQSPRYDSIFDLEMGNVIKNEIIELDRPMDRKAKKENKRPKDETLRLEVENGACKEGIMPANYDDGCESASVMPEMQRLYFHEL
ncbi:hypothetical protein L1987_14839 [Smallanthus sonchifolius]|uniref:Uncharacterized protein n=1 Tax=Smallanthus sonchifolius TaxID=185202 RepID=A0ACB9J6G9_9ASTR|nr:hypothetical protein L1987_14839 [Smallanthus sonchifolius]